MEKPSILQPWKKYYRENPFREFNVNQTFDELITSANCNNLNFNALNFMGIKGNSWTYKEVFELSNQLANAFAQAGVKKDDTVLISTIAGLEEPLCLLALNKIGAVSKWVDVTLPAEELEEAINAHNCKHVVLFSYVLNEFNKIINNTDVEKVLVVEPSQYFRPFKIVRESLSGIKELKNIADEGKKDPLPTIPNDKRYMKFMDFVKSGSKEEFNRVGYDKDKPSLIIQSSGTTGKPKSIVHTDYTINNSIIKFNHFDMPLFPKNVMLQVAPAWVGYGLINTLGVGLAYGMEVMTTPMLKENMLITLNQKYDVTFAAPIVIRYLYSHLDEVKEMSRPQMILSGGDKIDKSEIIKFQNAFGEKKCNASIINGAGNNEVLGAAYINPMHANKPGTVGIPMCNDAIGIFDPDTLEEKGFNEEGEVCIRSEATMLHYDNNEEQTNKTIRIHPDGNVWVHTNDLGKIDEDGFLYLIGRLNRVITVQSFKISASQIEEVVQAHEAVRDVVAVGVPDEELEHVPMLFIELEEKFKVGEPIILEEIEELCKKQLKGRAVPRYYKIVDKIPYTSNNKQDYRKLENDGKEYVESLNSNKQKIK